MPAVAQALAFSATIGGAAVADLIAVSCSAGVEQRFSRATLTVASDPGTLAAGADVVVSITVNGSTATLFRGDYTGQAWTLDAGRTINIECAGILARLQRPWGGPDRVYSPETTSSEAERVDAALTLNLAAAWGIPAERCEFFASEWENPDGAELDPINWVLGEIEPVVLKNGESPLQLIDAIDEVPGFRTYDQLTGYIQRARYNPYYAAPTVDAAWVEGQDGVRVARLGPTFGEIVNRVIVRGLTSFDVPVEAGWEAANPDLNGFYPPELHNAYVGRELQSDLIEFPHFAQQAAAIQVQDTNRRTDGWEIVLAGDPQQHTLELQVTVSLDFPSLGSTGPTKHRIISIAHELSANPWSFVTTIRTNGGELV